ncbi:hypothetical protein Pmani_015758 [Petrolisthes manimaculis]|uniref:Uncharacterized protein n=1 Tax=Petrolisthes manimaculis TaxID=1843537 RepID=A0AAE1PQZ7_9EUCA|nr:hypothetical protein Pmani_015758 [Petrolisthes manimaculis]
MECGDEDWREERREGVGYKRLGGEERWEGGMESGDEGGMEGGRAVLREGGMESGDEGGREGGRGGGRGFAMNETG